VELSQQIACLELFLEWSESLHEDWDEYDDNHWFIERLEMLKFEREIQELIISEAEELV